MNLTNILGATSKPSMDKSHIHYWKSYEFSVRIRTPFKKTDHTKNKNFRLNFVDNSTNPTGQRFEMDLTMRFIDYQSLSSKYEILGLVWKIE